MSKSVVNVFSKQARFQDLGSFPPNRGDLKGWPITQGFLPIVDFPTGNFMSNYVVKVFSEHAKFQDPRPIPSKRGDLQGLQIIQGFISIVAFPTGNSRLIMWSTFSRNRSGFWTCDQFRRIDGISRGDQLHRVLFLSLIFRLEI